MNESDLIEICELVKNYCIEHGYNVNKMDLEAGVEYYNVVSDPVPTRLLHKYNLIFEVSEK